MPRGRRCAGRFSSGLRTDEADVDKTLYGNHLRGQGALYADHDTDAASIALCRRHDNNAVPSFDDDFDGLVNRLDPADISR
jgi:hypothetical protein